MGLRPAKCYRRMEKPYTRYSRRKPKKSYVKAVPDRKIHKFETGNKKKEFPLKGRLVVESSVQIRHNVFEAMRISASKFLSSRIGDDFFMKILVYPHHILRENPLATGAGADRFQTGMRKAFGKPIGTAAQVKSGQSILEIRSEKNKKEIVKKAFKLAAAKVPSKCRVVFND